MNVVNKFKLRLYFFYIRYMQNFKFLMFVFHLTVVECDLFKIRLYISNRYNKILRINACKLSCNKSRLIKTDQRGILMDKENVKQDFVQIVTADGTQENANSKREEKIVSKLPIVFIHLNNSDYLKYSLGQSKKSNPESTVYLIGDSSNNCYDFVEHHSLSEYSNAADDFAKIYKHYSSNAIKFELYCFQRWFVLKEFLISNKLEKCLYLDSDVMLYVDVTEEQVKFEQYDFTLCHMSSGGTFFLNRIDALESFCQFLMDVYKKKDRYNYDKMVAHFMVRRKNSLRGGVCDMTAFELYNFSHLGVAGEMIQIIDGSVYDSNINRPYPGFEMSNEIKKITWKNDLPYGTHVRTGCEVKFNTLHFQGKAKSLMKQFYTQ